MKEYQITVTEKELQFIVNALLASSSKAYKGYTKSRDANLSEALWILHADLYALYKKIKSVKGGEE